MAGLLLLALSLELTIAKPQPDGRELDEGLEVGGALLLACGDAPAVG